MRVFVGGNAGLGFRDEDVNMQICKARIPKPLVHLILLIDYVNSLQKMDRPNS